jgi:DNA-binding transcriptional MerR regulator
MNSRESNKTYSVGELAALAGVTVRTLRYYDEINLLCPSRQKDNDYRSYDFSDLLRLQQILFFRELEVPLMKIREILNDPATDPVILLEHHRENIRLKIDRLKTLQLTLEKTIQNQKKEGQMPLTDAELYEGFDQTVIERYNREVREKYDPRTVIEVNRKIRSLSKAQWQSIQTEGTAIAKALARLMDRDPTDRDVQVLAARQHAWIENFFPVTAEAFLGLADLYAENPEFRDHYDRFAPGLAGFLRQAMQVYARENLTL